MKIPIGVKRAFAHVAHHFDNKKMRRLGNIKHLAHHGVWLEEVVGSGDIYHSLTPKESQSIIKYAKTQMAEVRTRMRQRRERWGFTA